MQTKIVSLNGQTDISDELKESAEVIKAGGLVVFPTETVYGLGADATNECAAQKIYAAKGRPSDNPLIIHIADPNDVERYAFSNSVYYLLAEKFMPGPITIILTAKNTIPKATRGGLDTVAVRCPSNPIANTLIKLAGVPIAAPSANISGSPSPTNVRHVIEDMMGKVDVIIDGGDSDFGLESTIVSIESDDTVTLLRPGKITVDDLEALGLNVKLASAVTDQLQNGETAISPGMKYKHYAPKSPLILIDSTRDKSAEYIRLQKKSKCAVISYTDDIEFYRSHLGNVDIYDFGNRDDQLTQAHLLFKILRNTDQSSYDAIYAPLPKINGIGLALYNRMIRAAAHKIIRL